MAKPYVPTLREAYYLFNSRYFRSKLTYDVVLQWRDIDHLAEYLPSYSLLATRTKGDNKGTYRKVGGRKETIYISKKTKDSSKIWMMSLLHEMVHLKLKNAKGSYHGHAFQREMKRLANAGAFNGLW